MSGAFENIVIFARNYWLHYRTASPGMMWIARITTLFPMGIVFGAYLASFYKGSGDFRYMSLLLPAMAPILYIHSIVTLKVSEPIFVHLAELRARGLIAKPPGHHVLLALSWLFPRKDFEAIFAQIFIDMREEYFEALERGCRHKATWRRLQLYLILLQTIALLLGVKVVKRWVSLWRIGQ